MRAAQPASAYGSRGPLLQFYIGLRNRTRTLAAMCDFKGPAFLGVLTLACQCSGLQHLVDDLPTCNFQAGSHASQEPHDGLEKA